MLDYNQIKPRAYIILDGEPYECIENHVAKKNRGKPSNQTKIKSLISGKVIEKTFHASDKVEEAIIETKDIRYLYQKRDEIWFCEPDNPRERFMLESSVVEDKLKYLKENDTIKGVYFNEQVISIKTPIKVDLVVTEAPEAVKGNTAQGALKRVTLENGLEIMVPLFIKEGQTITVNTETGEYAGKTD